MKSYITENGTIWEETDMIVIRNFPPSNMTFSYIQRVFKKYKRDKIGHKEVYGNPIYFHELTQEQRALAIIMANAQNALLSSLPLKEDMKEIKL